MSFHLEQHLEPFSLKRGKREDLTISTPEPTCIAFETELPDSNNMLLDGTISFGLNKILEGGGRDAR